MSDTPTSNSSEMVETVARAICTADHANHSNLDWAPCSGDCESCILGYIPIARAAINAMREPGHTLDRVVSRIEIDQSRADPVQLRGLEIWQSMIAAALSETPEAGEG